MMFRKLFFCFGLAVLTAAAAMIYSAPPGSPAPPTSGVRQGAGAGREMRIIIPAVKSELKRSVIGKVNINCVLPPNQSASSVVYYINNQEIGRTSERPYRITWDSASVKDGEYTVRWAGLDENGKEAAAGSMTLVVANKNSAGGVPTAPQNGGKPPTSIGNGEKPTAIANIAPLRWTVYGSEKYKIWFEYPVSWTVKDQSAGVDKSWVGGYWLIVATDPTANAETAINIRHRILSREHTTESFIKYNSYLTSWDHTDIGGRDAFITTDGSPTLKRVVHRAIILEGKHCWMLRCIDISGKPDNESRDIFMRIAEGLSLTPKQAPPIKGNGLNQNEPGVNPPKPPSDDDTTPNQPAYPGDGDEGPSGPQKPIDDPDSGFDGGWPTEDYTQ